MNLHAYKVVPTDSVTPYANNPRTHSDEQITQIRRSIREFGFTNPLLIDEGGQLIAGHSRLLAAKAEGLTELPAIEVAGLNEAQRKALVLADNQLAANAGWNYELLKVELSALTDHTFDLTLIGFTDAELADLLPPTEPAQFGAATAQDQGRLDQRSMIICPNCQHEFTFKF